VKIHGDVTKYNHIGIKKNRVHLQEGTGYSEQFELAVKNMGKHFFR
jgi:hypothetical protein